MANTEIVFRRFTIATKRKGSLKGTRFWSVFFDCNGKKMIFEINERTALLKTLNPNISLAWQYRTPGQKWRWTNKHYAYDEWKENIFYPMVLLLYPYLAEELPLSKQRKLEQKHQIHGQS